VLKDVSMYPSLVTELVAQGLHRKDMEGIVGRKILRVLAKLEPVAKRMGRVIAEMGGK